MTLSALKGLADLMGTLGRYRKLSYFKGFNLLIRENGVNRRSNFLWWLNVRSNMYFTAQSFQGEYLAPPSTLVHEFPHLYVVILNNECGRGNEASTMFGDEIFPTENINKRWNKLHFVYRLLNISSILCFPQILYYAYILFLHLSTYSIFCVPYFSISM